MKIASKIAILILGGALACSSPAKKAGPDGGPDAASSTTTADAPIATAGATAGAGGSSNGGGATVPSSNGADGSAGAGTTNTDRSLGSGGGGAGNGGTGGQPSSSGGSSAPDAGTGKGDGAADAFAAEAHSLCGNGVLGADEQCDDGNLVPFDGCSALCRLEPRCTTGACTSTCGDGLVIGEDCDDGNTRDGDGCSSACKIEAGWTCAQPPIGDKMTVPAVYRDFRYHNPADFEAQGKGVGTPIATPGMVKEDLDAEGKPVFTGLTGKTVQVESASSFEKWYRDVAGVNHRTVGQLALWKTSDGVFVNRRGPNGEQWNATEKAYYCGMVGEEKLDDNGKPIPCTSRLATTECTPRDDKGMERLKCLVSDGTYQAIYVIQKLDGEPLWFPVDGDTTITPKSEFEPAMVPPIYETGNEKSGTWPYDLDDGGNKILHNFSFTSEFRSWFKYEAAKTITLEFIGDEDVWLFINKRLALDLGGIHMPVKGSVTLNPATAEKLGLVDGQFYELAVFQSERQSNGSTLKVTLPGFNTAPSTCTKQ